MARAGLVLGAGGLTGQAYHAGVLAALEAELGWDPRSAELVVGSSAGSLTGAALRLGVPAHDLAASALGTELSAEGAFLAAFDQEGPEIPPFDARHALHGWRLPSVGLLARTVRRPWEFRPSAAAATLLPAGFVDITGPADTLAPHLGTEWPDGLWICAARRSDGARVAFGRAGSPPAPLGRAVAASCAIPGYFSPVEIDGVEYVDGGVHSPTNADIVRNEGLDLVIVSSPMSAAHGRMRGADAGIRWALHRRLDLEVRRLRRAGAEVVRIEPKSSTRTVMGVNAMADDRAGEVADAARSDTAAYLALPRVAARLAALPRNARPRIPAR
ncbi:patatin-like phospholipase family protein [Aquihabitans sp. G128]|uniref:patatin-like phospholipase family protein n=1 Tax=Aquihabitans sp. G128 TaxID=2849779 RepID=UPI001C217971|nr:patatin-like phospholipase family protein [Aquihabitans sp. G128]QXC62461.1 patatin-like phospholipase family protein [Aquihabitans sp. G128]